MIASPTQYLKFLVREKTQQPPDSTHSKFVLVLHVKQSCDLNCKNLVFLLKIHKGKKEELCLLGHAETKGDGTTIK